MSVTHSQAEACCIEYIMICTTLREIRTVATTQSVCLGCSAAPMMRAGPTAVRLEDRQASKQDVDRCALPRQWYTCSDSHALRHRCSCVTIGRVFSASEMVARRISPRSSAGTWEVLADALVHMKWGTGIKSQEAPTGIALGHTIPHTAQFASEGWRARRKSRTRIGRR